ncbi:MAG: ABC transporter substrate-binding protein [bacterium]
MRICETCGGTFSDGLAHCPTDHVPLIEANDELVGRKVGRYVITRRIGKGARGHVYLALQPVIGSRVAIKVLHTPAAEHSDEFGRFVIEAQAVNRINHPNIIRIMDMATLEGDRPYILMEYLEGTTLRDRMLVAPALAPERACEVVTAVLAALEAAHNAGFVHRDLKPENIFLTRSGQVKLLDFGIAKLLGEDSQKPITKTGTVVGTPMYLSPEQALGRKDRIGPWTDLYSMGVLLYELYTGRSPFETRSVSGTIMAHLEEPPIPPSEAHPQISPEMERIILWCLEKDPPDRPQNVAELLTAYTNAQSAYESAEPGVLPSAALPRFSSSIMLAVSDPNEDEKSREAQERRARSLRSSPSDTRRSSPAALGERERKRLTLSGLFKGSARDERLQRRRIEVVMRWIYATAAVLLVFAVVTLIWKASRPARSDTPRGIPVTAAVQEARRASKEQATQGRIVVLQVRRVQTVDPVGAVTSESFDLVHQTHEGLVRYDLLSGRVRPILARSWKRTGTTYTFELRQGVRFHDDTPLTPKIVVASLRRTLASPFGKAMLWDIEEVSAAPPHAVRLKVKEYSPSLLMRLSLNPGFIAKPTLPYPVGTGPYKVASWNRQLGIVVLKAHHAHWQRSARIETVVFRAADDPETAVSLLIQGAAHILPSVSLQTANRLRRHDAVVILRAPAQITSYLVYNTRQPHLRDPLIRRALSQAVDRKEMVKRVWAGNARVAFGSLAPRLGGPPDPTSAPPPFAPEQARAALKGKPVLRRTLRLLLPEDARATLPAPKEAAALLVTAFKSVGVNVKPEILKLGEFMKRVRAGDHDLAIVAWSPDYPDPENVYMLLGHSGTVANLNFSHFSDQQFDRVLQKARREKDTDARQMLFARLEHLVARQQPWLPLAFVPTFLAKRREVHGLRYATSLSTEFFLNEAFLR